jgi:hypothetical protein
MLWVDRRANGMDGWEEAGWMYNVIYDMMQGWR